MKASALLFPALGLPLACASPHAAAPCHEEQSLYPRRPLPDSPSAMPGVLHLPLTRQRAVASPRDRHRRRQQLLGARQLPGTTTTALATDTAALLNNVTAGAYVTTVQVGTPPQQLTLQVDTGSSDLWLPSVTAPTCVRGGPNGCFYGSFNPATSSSFRTLAAGAFTIRYGDGSGASGDYVSDALSVGGATLSSLIMGLGTQMLALSFGIAGIGLPADETVLAIDPNGAYPNLPVQMANLGLISSTAYSLWLNDLDASTGSILFGGIDTAKFHGPLSRLILYPSPGSAPGTNASQFLVGLTSVTASSSSGTDALGSASFPMAVLLDSGTTLAVLPADLVAAMYAEAGVVALSMGPGPGAASFPSVPCDFATRSPGNFTFGFGGPSGPAITVGMGELVQPAGPPGTTPPAFPADAPNGYGGKAACVFGILPADANSPEFILGDVFLRSAYVVYDLENLEVAMAPTVFNASATNVVAFPSRGAVIPNSTPAPSQDPASLIAVAVQSSPAQLAASKGFVPTSGAAPSGPGSSTAPGTPSAAALAWLGPRVLGLGRGATGGVPIALVVALAGLMLLM